MLNMFMKKRFVKVQCEVYCQGWTEPPVYRAFVNDELFAERTWVWENAYLEEAFQIQAPPGKYKIRYELIDNNNAELRLKNGRVEFGPGVLHKHDVLEIFDENK